MIRRAMVRVTTPSGATYDVPLTSNRITIGRGSGCDVRLQDPLASREHAVLVYGQGQWYVQDRGSRNGTLLNGQRIEAGVLREGDQLTIGDSKLVVSLGEPAPAAPKSRVRADRRLALVAVAAVAVLLVVAGVVLMLQGRSPHSVQTLKTDGTGVAVFRDGATGQDVAVKVVDADGRPLEGMTVAYEHDGRWGYEAYFVRDEDGLPAAVAFYSHNSRHEIQVLPNVMHAASADEARALGGYLAYLGRQNRSFYQETASGEDYAARLSEADPSIQVELGPKTWFYGVYISPTTALDWEGERDQYTGQWDLFQARSAAAGCDVAVAIASQAPAMKTAEVKAGEDGAVHVSWSAADPAAYPEHLGRKLDLPDPTLLEGATKAADLTYHYRLLDESGAAHPDWTETPQKAIDLKGLADGNYTLEVYATDEVDNRSDTLTRQFSLGSSGGEPQAPTEATAPTPTVGPTQELEASATPTPEATATEGPTPEMEATEGPSASPSPIATTGAPPTGSLDTTRLTSLATLDTFRRTTTVTTGTGEDQVRNTLTIEFVRQPEASHIKQCTQMVSGGDADCIEDTRVGAYAYMRVGNEDWARENAADVGPTFSEMLNMADVAQLEEWLDIITVLGLKPELGLQGAAGTSVDAQTVNGVACRHYHYDLAALQHAVGLLSYFGDTQFASGQADVWVSSQQNVPIRVTLEATLPVEEGYSDAMRIESNVLDINQPLQIQAPQNILE